MNFTQEQANSIVLIVNPEAESRVGCGYYELFEGGYLDPEHYLLDGAEQVREAMHIITKYFQLLEENGLNEQE